MRTYGRITNLDGTKSWRVVTTNAAGYNDGVYATTVAQVLKLNLGESPFNANYGIPAHQSIAQQVFPDFYIAYTQQQFARFFASLLIAKEPITLASPDPLYRLAITTQQGYRLDPNNPIPT